MVPIILGGRDQTVANTRRQVENRVWAQKMEPPPKCLRDLDPHIATLSSSNAQTQRLVAHFVLRFDKVISNQPERQLARHTQLEPVRHVLHESQGTLCDQEYNARP